MGSFRTHGPILLVTLLLNVVLGVHSVVHHQGASISFSDDGKVSAATFMDVLASKKTDVLIYLYGNGCPDCRKFDPEWQQALQYVKGWTNLTVLRMEDWSCVAPGKYSHNEVPAVYYASKDSLSSPKVMPMTEMHAFTYTTTTADTRAKIRFDILKLVPGAMEAVSETKTSDVKSSSTSGKHVDTVSLNSRLLADLSKHTKDSTSEQMKIVKADVYDGLAVAEYIRKLNPALIKEPLAVVAAKYLDEHK
eukprot:TRINITY_DN63750_c0_g1_i1.p1 TRINITY_DN63750_c0_g1~~TRINITY_DN63750_c0_g1_i1.p1  ORF type:complete len:249 (+),score=50.10 TRINITY_DN63750_c0_g1_i1:53-799(+)